MGHNRAAAVRSDERANDDDHHVVGQAVIRLGLVGLTDPRHRWFLSAWQRRRAGIRVVGASEPDPELRTWAPNGDLPIFPDHLALLRNAEPDLVAVTGQPSRSRVVLDALDHGRDVVAVPPLADDLSELAAIATAVADSSRRCLAVTTLRGQPAALLARQLLADHRLGRLDVVTLIVPDDCDAEERRRMTVDVLDLFLWLTGGTSGTIRSVDDGHPARQEDPPEFTAGYGKLVILADTVSAIDGSQIVCEVRSRPGPAEWPVTVQVGGSAGAVEWDVRSGMLRSAVADSEPRLISAGRIDHAEWVLNNLLRRQHADFSTAQSLATSRMLLQADRSAENDGAPECWQL